MFGPFENAFDESQPYAILYVFIHKLLECAATGPALVLPYAE
jgi:hypothetical protein